MGIIYMLTFPSKKSYIGQTVTPFNERFYSHVQASKQNKGGCHCVNAAIRKYGVDNIKKEILLEVNNELLNHYEELFIASYRTLVPHGYNIQKGGASFRNTDNYRRTLSEIHKEKYQNDENIRAQIKANGHKTKKNQSLPDYMTEERDYKKDKVIGYRVYRHPMCRRSRKFCSLKVTLEENYKQAFEYLTYLNSLTTPIEYVEKPVIGRKREGDKTLPKYVVEVKKKGQVIGYMVNTHKKDVPRASFISQMYTLEENKQKAIEFLHSIINKSDEEEVQRLNGNGSVV